MKLKFNDIELAFNFVSSGRRLTNEAFISRTGGQIYYRSAQETWEELPEDIDDVEKYISVPHKNDMDLGIAMALRFVEEVAPDELELVSAYFRAAGAYRRFKIFLERNGLLERWYAYEEAHRVPALRTWCEEQGIALIE